MAWFALLVVLFTGLIGASAVQAADERPAMGAELKPLTLRDSQDREHATDAWRDKPAVVLLFISTECPISNGYSPQMQRIASKYAEQGVVFLGVYCDPSVTADMANEHATEFGLNFPLLLDPEQQLARAVGARFTPEAVVISRGGVLSYRGRIDDQFAARGKRREVASEPDLENALDAVLAGKEPSLRETKAIGCPLPKVRARAGAN